MHHSFVDLLFAAHQGNIELPAVSILHYIACNFKNDGMGTQTGTRLGSGTSQASWGDMLFPTDGRRRCFLDTATL
jgi:hypothetical protein